MKISYSGYKGSVEIAPGISIWERVEVTLTGYRDYNLDAVVALNNGRLEVETLSIHRTPEGPSVTGEGIRKIAVQFIINDAAQTAIQSSRNYQAGTHVSGNGLLDTDEALRLKALGPKSETLEWVGSVYKLSVILGQAPTKAVEATFQISRSTAGAWIGRARAAGHIPPTGDNNAQA